MLGTGHLWWVDQWDFVGCMDIPASMTYSTGALLARTV